MNTFKTVFNFSVFIVELVSSFSPCLSEDEWAEVSIIILYWIGTSLGHRRLQIEVGVSPPTLWRFINTLRQSQKSRDPHYNQLESQASQPPPKKKKAILREERIQNIVRGYGNREIIEYLRALAHNL